MNINSLSNKIVVVTGASAGIGRATALNFAKHAATVALIARGRAGLEGAKREIEAIGGKAHIFLTDVSQADQVEKTAAQIEHELGPIDIWINNAMASIFAPFDAITPEEFKRVTEVTYLGQVNGTRSALKYMRRRDRGIIILIGSALAYRSIPLQSPYCGAKHALEGFFASLRSELLHDKSKVHLGIVHLPGSNTPQFDWVRNKLPNRPQPIGFVFQPEVAAEAIVFAALKRRQEIYVGWPTFKAILGNKMFPRLLDRYLAKVGYKGQMTDQPEIKDRADNLFEPVNKDFGIHGRFNATAHQHSLFLWFVKHRTGIRIGFSILGLIILLILLLVILF
ncbi:MAG: SDR family oxidoreductase [Proteobacteria bacterium]|nr:SDR family oxidoreductase [Pseudomonadota bacterium]